MEKLELYGLSKEEDHCVFQIEKAEIFLKYFRGFLEKSGFNKYELIKILEPLGDSDNNYSERKYSNKLYSDKYFYFKNKEYKIDVFFGKEIIFVSIFTELNKQQEITDKIFEFCEFKK